MLSDELREELDGAIRTGLRDAGVQGVLAHIVSAILPHIEKALTTAQPTVEQVADAIERDAGFMRIGPGHALIDGKIVGPDRLISAHNRYLLDGGRAMPEPRVRA